MTTHRNTYQIRECENPACLLRYPLVEAHPFGERCPLCLGPTQAALERPLHKESAKVPESTDSPPLEALLDNVRSAWNVGAIFRTSDGLGVAKLHLCGITPTPENQSVAKTALGADQIIPWTQARNALSLAEKLLAEGVRLWALEQDERAIPVSTGWETDQRRIVLIIGNEVRTDCFHPNAGPETLIKRGSRFRRGGIRHKKRRSRVEIQSTKKKTGGGENPVLQFFYACSCSKRCRIFFQPSVSCKLTRYFELTILSRSS
ncbi:MAG: hypothetical protein NT121_06020 [Chloroflexi bacterium]|nr:hypothetical protein [Chloroflexota bacterium]